MSTSPYFNHSRDQAEQDLHYDLSDETIFLSGVEAYYMPARRDRFDPILGEPIRTSFPLVFPIPIYMPDGGNREGDGEIMTKFGFAQRESLEVLVSKRVFLAAAEKVGFTTPRPREGDLIYIGNIDDLYEAQVNMFFEISHVRFESNQWKLGKTFVHSMRLVAWSPSHEAMTTATPIDDNVGAINDAAMENSINAAVKSTKEVLVAFKKNPLSNI